MPYWPARSLEAASIMFLSAGRTCGSSRCQCALWIPRCMPKLLHRHLLQSMQVQNAQLSHSLPMPANNGQCLKHACNLPQYPMLRPVKHAQHEQRTGLRA